MNEHDWESVPDIHEVRDALFQQAACRARLKIAKLELDIYQAELVQRKPRDASVKIIGVDDESRAKLHELQLHVLSAEDELNRIDAEVKFNSHRIDAAKAFMYRNRL